MEKELKRVFSLALVFCLLLLTVCCGAESVVLTDAAGRTVILDKEPERVVSGYFIPTSMVIALGQKQKLVGIEAKANTREIYALAAPELLSLPSVGSMKKLDLEAVLALRPDLVILPLAQLSSAETLAELGIPAVTVNPESYTLLRETIGLLASALGADDEALLRFTEETETLLSERLAGAERPLVYLAGNSGMLRTAGRNMYQDTLLRMAGAENAAAEIPDGYWADIGYEQLLSWDPEVIVIAAEAGYTPEDVLADPMLREVRAVKDGRVYAFPSSPEAWDSPCPASVLGSLWLARTLHPDRVSEEELNGAVTAFYSEFYGIED